MKHSLVSSRVVRGRCQVGGPNIQEQVSELSRSDLYDSLQLPVRSVYGQKREIFRLANPHRIDNRNRWSIAAIQRLHTVTIMNPLLSCQPSNLTVRSCLSRSAELFKFTSRRHQSSYRRTRSRLNIKPDASFLPSRTEPHDHIIYNPPPSAPNVYHTPTIFLPKSDKRRRMHDLATQRDPQLAAGATPWSSTHRLPPPVRKPYEKRYHITEAQMEEMRRLRKEDPVAWSVTALAKKFDCSRIFVSFVTEGLSQEKQKQQKMVTEVIKSRWGTKRRVAREDRALRKERWYSDS